MPKYQFYSNQWLTQFFSTVTTEGGTKATNFHLRSLVDQGQNLSREGLKAWIFFNPKYELIRARLAVKITKQTTGFDRNDTRVFARIVWNLMPVNVRPPTFRTTPQAY